MAYTDRLHKTLAQLRRWPTEDLCALAEQVQDLIAERHRQEEAPIPVKEGRIVVDERQEGKGTLRLEYIRCGKERCHCEKDQGHGPYWYAYRKQGGRLTSEYIGKDLGKFTRAITRERATPGEGTREQPECTP